MLEYVLKLLRCQGYDQLVIVPQMKRAEDRFIRDHHQGHDVLYSLDCCCPVFELDALESVVSLV